jgi:hypothetical protein
VSRAVWLIAMAIRDTCQKEMTAAETMGCVVEPIPFTASQPGRESSAMRDEEL